ncbi:MAG: cation-translocating P-type ATPase [Limnochordaceae bacterium]|nr:cation-translocating P-type ATPase [Limnochordaceae bacterium]
MGDAAPAPSTPWHALAPEEACRRLETDPQRGLSPTEVEARLRRFGPNAIPEAPGRTIWAMAWDQIREPLVLILIAAAVISVALGEWSDAFVILAIVILNAVLGVTQENRAEHALAALRELMHPNARVLRGGHLVDVNARELVPGDVVLVEAGSRVPADLRLVEAANLQADEAPLTGESVPVSKEAAQVLPPETAVADRTNLLYMGTVITYGRGVGVVVGTGLQTEMGRIAAYLRQEEPEPTPLQRRLAELGKVLGGIALGVVVVVFAVGLARGEPLLDMFMTAVSLAVAAIPEGLPAIVTIVLALGVQRMAARQAIVRRLPAVETLGAATVIASDKTGTITQNRMEAVRAWIEGVVVDLRGLGQESRPGGPAARQSGVWQSLDPAAAAALEWVLRGGSLVNDGRLERLEEERGWRAVGDPTETAILAAAARAGFWPEDEHRRFPRIGEVPFESRRKRMSTLHRNAPPAEEPSPGDEVAAAGDGALSATLTRGAGRGSLAWPGPELLAGAPYLLFTKGSPESVLSRCQAILRGGRVEPLDEQARQEVMEANAAMARDALRVLAVAVRPLQVPLEPMREEVAEQALVLLGLVGLIDPPRPEVAEAVRVSRRAGVRPIMITGDHRDTATAIASQVGLMRSGGTARVLTGVELDRMSDEDLERVVEDVDVYARVTPEHKLRVVEALRRRGHVVAVTGDGVNDAPALQRADIGAAMGITGTDVAKGAADMVLADDNFATVVAAVSEGRTIFENIKKFVHYLLSCNLGEIVTIFGAILLGLGRPLTAIQILWVNLVTDGLPALALGVDPPEPGLMERPPRRRGEGVFAGGMAWRDAYQGLMLGALTLAVYSWVLSEGHGIERARTAAFATLALSQLAHAFNIRSSRQSLVQVGPLSNRWLLGAFAISAALELVVLLWPPLAGVFGVTPLNGPEWEGILLAAFAPIPIVEAVKAVERAVARRRVAHE